MSQDYWGTEEYEQDQRNFEAGGQSPEEIFEIAQKWGIVGKCVHLADWERDTYISGAVGNHNSMWDSAGSPYRLSAVLHGKILDLGCGAATFLEVWEDTVTSVVAVDPALAGYANGAPHIARLGQVGKCLYVSGVIQDIEDEDFDTVFSFNAIDHGIDWEDIITHCHRVLKPGGFLVLGVHVADEPRTSYHRRLTHPSHFSLEALTAQITGTGFEILWQQQRPPGRPVFLSYTIGYKQC